MKFLPYVSALALTLCFSPAFAAGNSAAAHLCQKGGYLTLFDQQGIHSFKDVGSCVAYAASGKNLVGLYVTPYTADGTFSASIEAFGLKPDSSVDWYASNSVTGTTNEFIGGTGVTNYGTVSDTRFGLPCGQGWNSLYAVATTEEGAIIQSPPINSSCG